MTDGMLNSCNKSEIAYSYSMEVNSYYELDVTAKNCNVLVICYPFALI